MYCADRIFTENTCYNVWITTQEQSNRIFLKIHNSFEIQFYLFFLGQIKRFDFQYISKWCISIASEHKICYVWEATYSIPFKNYVCSPWFESLLSINFTPSDCSIPPQLLPKLVSEFIVHIFQDSSLLSVSKNSENPIMFE